MSTHPRHTTLGSLFFFFLNVFTFVPLSIRPRFLPPLLLISATVATLLFSSLSPLVMCASVQALSHSFLQLSCISSAWSLFLLSQFFFPFFCFSLLFCSVRALPPSTHSYSILFPHPPILPSLKTLSLSVLLTSCCHCVFLPYCPPPSTPVLLYLLNGFDQKDCYFLVFQSLLSLPSPAFVFSTHLKHTRLTPLFLSANHFLSFLC